MDPTRTKFARKGLYPFILLFWLAIEKANGFAVSELHHLRFCTGDEIDISCPEDSVIHIASSYFVYVHGVYEAGSNCQIHHNATQQCFRKIQFYDADYYAKLHISCQSQQRCDEGLVAKVGDPKRCWNYTHSPSDYLTFSYICVNVNGSNSPSTPTPDVPKSSTGARAIWSWQTTTKSRRTSQSDGPASNSRSPTMPWFITLPYKHTSGWHPTTRSHTTTPGGGRTLSWFLTGLTSSRYWTSSSHYTGRHYTTSRPYVTSTRQHNVLSTQTLARARLNKPDMLMTILVPTSVAIIVIAIVIIAAAIACRNPKKKSSVLRRRLSENSSVFFSNGDRDSISGDSVQTRASIHGIANPGFDLMGKPPLDVSYTDKIILNPGTLEDKPPLDMPDIHISPMYGNSTISDDIPNVHVYANVASLPNEPMSEQGFAVVDEMKNQHKSK